MTHFLIFPSPTHWNSIDTGGVSTNSQLNKKWNIPWVLESTAPMSDQLVAVNDSKTHYAIEPKQRMSQAKYEKCLKELNAVAKRVTKNSSK